MPALPGPTAAPAWIDPYLPRRRRTREVRVGKVGVGGDNPIRLQSMTTTDTLDVEATTAQALRLVEAGCEIIRVTAPTVNDARALGKIKEGLLQRGVDAPLVADIHFSPQAALESAEYAEKVRINPGNFVDSKRFAVKEYTDEQYAFELERIEEAFTPLVEKLKRLKRALRIGTNHGSLSDRILNRYGDTPLGMVESALEYVRICEKNGYREIILSMKASNPKVMVAAYRLLAARMAELGMDYPFHLGVTEAGDGEDGRIKSAIGIGGLLEDGIGDTIRVSLTEEPELEIPVCRALAAKFQPSSVPASDMSAGTWRMEDGQRQAPRSPYCADPFQYARRKSSHFSVGPFLLGGAQLVRVFHAAPPSCAAPELLALLEGQFKSGREQNLEVAAWAVRSEAELEALAAARRGLAGETSRLAFLVRFSFSALAEAGVEHADIAGLDPAAGPRAFASLLRATRERGIPILAEGQDAREAAALEREARAAGVPVLVSLAAGSLQEYRRLAALLADSGSKAPLHLRAPREAGWEGQVLQSSVLLGGLLCDGIGDSVEIDSRTEPRRGVELAYNILQGAGVRVTKTEFVSCPSCGRTLFDLQSTTERIKSKTGHLKGVKIAIMGCIVNGPGEMADADFGYVGGAPDRINLYVGKECVRKGIPTADADEALIELIKANGKWADPPSPA